jgi:diaminopimelate decarboxylase
MSDNLRPMLYGSRYEAIVASRAAQPPDTLATVAGMHCESGDILITDAVLAAPRPGDILVTPATGAYGYAMASNYNGVPRPPVVLCRDGDARLAVRRESYDDLTARDVD